MADIDGLKQSLDTIFTYLCEGEAWHRKSASECRRLFVRGWGRWHEAESECDHEALLEMSKLVRDAAKLHYSPVITSLMVEKANQYAIPDITSGFPTHHDQWIARENRLIDALNAAIPMAFEASDELYAALRALKCEVENEAMRVGMAAGRLGLAGWSGHDIGVCSRWIHDYFECEYKGGEIDFNIG